MRESTKDSTLYQANDLPIEMLLDDAPAKQGQCWTKFLQGKRIFSGQSVDDRITPESSARQEVENKEEREEESARTPAPSETAQEPPPEEIQLDKREVAFFGEDNHEDTASLFRSFEPAWSLKLPPISFSTNRFSSLMSDAKSQTGSFLVGMSKSEANKKPFEENENVSK